MKPKPTMSQDGELRFNLQVTVRAGLSELADAVAWRIAQEKDGDLREADDKAAGVDRALAAYNSRAAVLETLRETVAEGGEHYHYWGDHFGEYLCALLAAKSRAHVERLFPELTKPTT